MVILKRIKASTLMETLVATVIIVVIFIISSMILNNLFLNTINNNTRAIDAHLFELQYLYKNEQLIIPHSDDFENWEVTVKSQKNNRLSTIVFRAQHTKTNKIISKVLYVY